MKVIKENQDGQCLERYGKYYIHFWIGHGRFRSLSGHRHFQTCQLRYSDLPLSDTAERLASVGAEFPAEPGHYRTDRVRRLVQYVPQRFGCGGGHSAE